MSCPTCDHTMHQMHRSDFERMWWCPRCGTLKRELTKTGNTAEDAPALVERVRQLLEDVPYCRASAWKLGIYESIGKITTEEVEGE